MRHFEHVDGDVDEWTATLKFFTSEYTPVRNSTPAQRLHACEHDVTELTAIGRLAKELRPRIEAVLKADDELAAQPFGGFNHLRAFSRASRERLFAQHVTPRFKRADG